MPSRVTGVSPEERRARVALSAVAEPGDPRVARLATAMGPVELYERLRAHKGGVGAAPLRARRCEGCSLQINASDLGVIAKAPADEVIRCEECQRILVRTDESGL